MNTDQDIIRQNLEAVTCDITSLREADIEELQRGVRAFTRRHPLQNPSTFEQLGIAI